MKQTTNRYGQVFSFIALAGCLSCSPSSTPVQEGTFVGKWQRVDRPAVSMVFRKDQTFSAYLAEERLLGGTYRLVDGEYIVLDFDASSPKVGLATNRVAMSGKELRITSPGGETERYRRVEQRAQ